MTFIVDRQGVIRARIVGESTPEVFERAITRGEHFGAKPAASSRMAFLNHKWSPVIHERSIHTERRQGSALAAVGAAVPLRPPGGACHPMRGRRHSPHRAQDPAGPSQSAGKRIWSNILRSHCGMDRRKFHYSRHLAQQDDLVRIATCSAALRSSALNMDRDPRLFTSGLRSVTAELKPGW
ncbi:MAG: hypothetical protein R3F40_05045 [Candidatus Competibacteraceae bacterium]